MSNNELISQTRFEASLPCHMNTGAHLWKYVKYCDKREEHIYSIPVVGTPSEILIHSTIDRTGFCSIGSDRGFKIFCSDVGFSRDVMPSHIKRVPGWEKRLNMYLRFAYIAVKLKYADRRLYLWYLTKYNNYVTVIKQYKIDGKKRGKKRHARMSK